MPVSFSDLQLAFEFVSSGGMGENEAYLDRQSGKIYWHSEFGDNDEELPDDIDDENIFVERLWRSLKYEEVDLNAYATVAEAKAGIGSWLGRPNENRARNRTAAAAHSQCSRRSARSGRHRGRPESCD